METTTPPASWPRVEATLDQDGSAHIVIGGIPHTIEAGIRHEARPQVVELIARQAAQLRLLLRAWVTDRRGNGPW